ncbi:MAG: AAA family ATPase [Acetobacteraceae bacterium]
MRLCRLDLLRYGHLTDVTLDFPEGVHLHVVHGANEAGKSTALAAIADALFGFGHRTDFDFLHGGPQLRVGFEVATADGTIGTFIRRKGRRDTLRDAADTPLPDDALRRFLGGAGRELFERGFGLDSARLRNGGQELQRLGGEVGESLLAGAGLLNLRAVLGQIEEEARSLVGDGRGRRRLSEAVDSWRKAQHQSEDRAVAPREWQAAEGAHADAVASLANVQEQFRMLSEENNRLQRVRRVAPLLTQLADAREVLASLADAPHLPSDAEDRFHLNDATRREAGRDMEREAAEARRLAEEQAARPEDAPALSAQDAIDALDARRPVVLQAMTDLPKVQAEAAALRTKVSDAMDDLGLTLTPEMAREALPATAARRAVQRLITEHSALQTESRAATREMEAGQRRVEQAARVLAASVEPPSPALLRRTIDSVRGEGPLDASLVHLQQTQASAETAVDVALAALPLWRADLASLIACKLPLPAEIDTVAARLAETEIGLTHCRSGAAAVTSEIAALDEELSRLARGEQVPTPDAVATARAERDRIWRLIRRMHETGTPPATEEEAALPAATLPEAFEMLRDAADRLADRRADDAQRVAAFLAAQARRALLHDRLAATTAALTAAEDAARQAKAAWDATWAPACLVPLVPAAMAEWRRARADLLQLAEIAESARRECHDLAVRRDRAHAALATLLPPGSAQETLSALLLRAETVCAAAEGAATEHRARRQALAEAQERIPELQQAVDRSAQRLAAWQRGWTDTVAALRLPADATIEAAETALEAWAHIAEAAPAWRTSERRISDMTASINDFTIEVHALLARIDDAEPGEPAPQTAARLARRLTDARKAAAEAADLKRRIVAHETAVAAAGRRLAEAEASIDALRKAACVTDDAALQQAVDRARRRDAALATRERLEQDLATQGDGMQEAVLRAEAAQIDADAVVGRLADVGLALASLGERREELSALRARCEAKLAELREGRDAAAMAQQAEDALAEARAAAERYARLHVARVLLRAGIDRFRREQQGPLLRAAGRHFALLTNGRYERLVVDYDAAGRTVLLAIRDMGTECPVEALSEGARDQLYLALRVAAIEAYAAQAESLPFIADDLLVHFDDARAAAAIALLAELGRTSQVILFTHHDHIAALAARQDQVAVQHMPATTVPTGQAAA